MAGVQQEMGQYDAAEKIYLRTLQMRESLLGKHHPDVALTVNDIAVLYSRQNRFDEAVVYYQRALEIRRAVVGEQHADYAQALSAPAICCFPVLRVLTFPAYAENLATVYQDLGRYQEALPLFEKTLAVYKAALGEGHPNVASAYTGLAGLKQQMGNYSQCIPMYEKALEIYGALAGGAPDSDMALTLNGTNPMKPIFFFANPYFAQTLPFYISRCKTGPRQRRRTYARWICTNAVLASSTLTWLRPSSILGISTSLVAIRTRQRSTSHAPLKPTASSLAPPTPKPFMHSRWPQRRSYIERCQSITNILFIFHLIQPRGRGEEHPA